MKTLAEFISEMSDDRLKRYADRAAADLRDHIFSAPEKRDQKRMSKRTGGLQRAAARLRGEIKHGR